MKTNYVLIDYENVNVPSLELLVADHFRVKVFLGPNNTKLNTPLVLAMQRFQNRAEYVTLTKAGPNALDFHIAYYLGVLAREDPEGFFHIISKDTGFDPMIEHLKAKHIHVVRSASIEEMPCFAPKEKTKTDVSLDDVVVDLIRRKTSRPGTSKTLKSTIHARCGKDLEVTRVEAIYTALVKKGYVKIEGTKVTYNLPSVPEPIQPRAS